MHVQIYRRAEHLSGRLKVVHLLFVIENVAVAVTRRATLQEEFFPANHRRPKLLDFQTNFRYDSLPSYM